MNENISQYIHQLEILYKSELQKKDEIINKLRKDIEVLNNINKNNVNLKNNSESKNDIQANIINELNNISC